MTLNRLSIQDLLRGLFMALAVLIPWVYSTGFESAFTIPKLTTLRFITLSMVALWTIQIIAQRAIHVRRSFLSRWLVASVGVLGITTWTSTYFWVSFFGDQNRFLGFMTTLNLLFLTAAAVQLFLDRKSVLKYLQISVWTAITTGIYGVFQWQGWVGNEEWVHDAAFRVFGTMGHSNHFGAYLGFHLVLLVGLWARSPHRTPRMLYAAGAIPMGLSLIATASRGALVATLIGLGVFGVGLAFRKMDWIRKQRRRLGLGMVAALVLLVALFQPIVTYVSSVPVVSRTLDTIEFIQAGNIPDRVSWWESSIAMIADAPLFGHGVSTYFATYNLYRRTDYRVPGDIQDTFTPETAHMEYLDIAATQGLIGLIVYLMLVGSVLWALVKTLRHQEVNLPDKLTALSLLGALTVYLTQVLLSFGVLSTLVPFYALLGVSAAWYHMTADPQPQSKQFHRISLKAGVQWSLFIGLSVVGIFSAWFTVRQAQAEWQLDRALHYRDQGEVALALEAHKKSTVAMPWMFHYWEAYGQTAFDFTATTGLEPEIMDYLLSTSAEAYANAYRLVQTLPHIQANWAIVALTFAEFERGQGHSTEADLYEAQGLDLYQEATEVAVNNPLFTYNYGLILRSMKQPAAALEAFESTLAIRTPYQDASFQAAWMATEIKDYETARLYIQQALQETPGDENVKILLQRINSED